MRHWLQQRCRYQLDSTDVQQIMVLMYVAAATSAQNLVRTHLLVALLLQPHQCEQVHLIQWNPIVTATFLAVAAAVAAQCERTLKSHNANLHLIEQSRPHTRLYYRLYPSLK